MILGNATGVQSTGGHATVHLADSTVSGNTIGLRHPNNGQIISHRGNVLTDNGNDGTFTSTVNQQ